MYENTANSQTALKRQQAIPSALDKLENNISAMGATIDELEKRLCQVIQAVPPIQETNTVGNVIDGQTPMVQRINQASGVVTRLGIQIRSLIDRLEV